MRRGNGAMLHEIDVTNGINRLPGAIPGVHDNIGLHAARAVERRYEAT